ncbi:MAG TPA: hypothetical protein VLK58_00695 [Conexibacter sp.]|nr:hypothetical protein [Conexibacter sp.]
MLDAAIRDRLTDRHGARAAAWLDALPSLAATLAARWLWGARSAASAQAQVAAVAAEARADRARLAAWCAALSAMAAASLAMRAHATGDDAAAQIRTLLSLAA